MERPIDPPAPPSPATTDPRRERSRSARLVAVFLLGCVGFAGPLFRIASRPAAADGWPPLFVFLFTFWALLIALIALAQSSRRGG